MRNKYRVENGIVYIELRRLDSPNIETMVDVDDLSRLLEYNVRWSYHGKYVSCSYTNEQGKTAHKEMLHRFLMGTPEGMVVDHINHNPLDNRKANLRNVSTAENNFNQQGSYSNSKSGIRGVSWDKVNSKWVVYVTKNKKTYHGGRFENIELAQRAAEQLRELLQQEG